jgi:hypothetical protein
MKTVPEEYLALLALILMNLMFFGLGFLPEIHH